MLTHLILWLLLASSFQLSLAQTDPDAQQLQAPRPRGRIRIADMQMARPPPVQAQSNWPSFNPVEPIQLSVPVLPVPIPPSSRVHTHIPLLRQQPKLVPPSEGRIQEAVVYGNWKPEHPLKPDEDQAQPKQRVYGRLEAMLMGLPAEGVDRRDTSSEELQLEQEQRTATGGNQNLYARHGSFERSQETKGRWRQTMSNVQQEQKSQMQFEAPIEVVRMNATDPWLRNMAEQINQSIETSTAHRQQTQTIEDNWMPLPNPYPTHSYESTQPVQPATVPRVSSTQAPTISPSPAMESTTMSLNWPTDFLDATSSSTERVYTNAGISIDRIDEDVVDQSEDYKYYEESLNSAQMHSELSVPESLIPQLPLNITRVGIPYEERNSAEEPTICVPLTVTETASESATPLLVELERIYCFPLPKVEIRPGNSRQHKLQPKEQEQSTSSTVASPLPTEQSQPALTASASRRNSLALLLIICWSSVLARL